MDFSQNIAQRKKAIILGILIGDALSHANPYELVSSMTLGHQCCQQEDITQWPMNYSPLSRQTDDTEQSLLLLESLCEAQKENRDPIELFERKLIAWGESNPPEISKYTLNTLRFSSYFAKTLASTDSCWWHEGAKLMYQRDPTAVVLNGSLMRNGVIAAWTLDKSDEEALSLTIEQCIATHWHPLCVLTCCLHTLFIRFLQCNSDTAFSEQILQDLLNKWAVFKQAKTHAKDCASSYLNAMELELLQTEQALYEHLQQIDLFDPYHAGTSIFSGAKSCVFTLKVALWAWHWSVQSTNLRFSRPMWLPEYPFHKRKFETLYTVPLIGQDSASYGAVTGALLASAYPEAIPKHLIDNLEVASVIIEQTNL